MFAAVTDVNIRAKILTYSRERGVFGGVILTELWCNRTRAETRPCTERMSTVTISTGERLRSRSRPDPCCTRSGRTRRKQKPPNNDGETFKRPSQRNGGGPRGPPPNSRQAPLN